MSGSKTKYYVSSSTFPVFDPDPKKRVDQFQAGTLAWAYGTPIEYSEYIKNYFNFSKLKAYRGYIRWCEKQGFTKTFGNITSDFYSNASFDNTVVADAIKSEFTIGPDDEFGVYNTHFNFFSEDFCAKAIATQQGKAYLFHDNNTTYTLEFPSENTITIVFSNGETITGNIPPFEKKSRFLEISYTLIKREFIPSPLPPVDPQEPEGTWKSTTIYGYKHYKEDSGNPTLDKLIKNNGITTNQSFFPVIPIRTNTAWFTGNKADMIGRAIKYLEVYGGGAISTQECYKKVCDAIVDGMKDGSISDLDYITLFPGIALNTVNQSDIRYIYEFFFNLYFNQALAEGREPEEINTPKFFDNGQGHTKSLFAAAIKAWGSDDGLHSFKIHNDATNLNLTYSWDSCEYGETNGTWKPGAKVGEYGLLLCHQPYTRTVVTHTYDEGGDNGSPHWDESRHKETAYYDLIAFAYQFSPTRYRALFFVNLSLKNLVYHGKSVYTAIGSLFDDVKSTGSVTLDLTGDIPILNPSSVAVRSVLQQRSARYSHGDSYVTYEYPSLVPRFPCKYIIDPGDSNTALVIPLEQNTFNEIGYVNQATVAYGSLHFVINCWIKKKKKWYQSGFFGAILAVVAVIVACVSQQWYIVGFAWGVAIGAGLSIIINMASRLLVAIFGESFGGFLAGIIQAVYKYVVTAVVYELGWYSPFGWGLMIGMTIADMENNLVNGMSFKDAFIRSFANNAGALGSFGLAKAFSGLEFVSSLTETTQKAGQLAIYSSSSTFFNSIASGNSFGDAFKKGALTGALTFIGAKTAFSLPELSESLGVLESLNAQLDKFNEALTVDPSKFTTSLGESLGLMQDLASKQFSGVITNPNTYAKLLGASQELWVRRKFANLENDYQEFNNSYKSALDALWGLQNLVNHNVTLEYLVKLQTTCNRDLDNHPGTTTLMSPGQFLTIATATGSDLIKGSLGSICLFANNKLGTNGFEPYQYHYNQMDYSLSWDFV